jgi:hypothetical protein
MVVVVVFIFDVVDVVDMAVAALHGRLDFLDP